MAQRILDRYFMAGGLPDGASHATTMALSHQPTQAELELVVIADRRCEMSAQWGPRAERSRLKRAQVRGTQMATACLAGLGCS